MSATDGEPRAVIVLVVGDREVPLTRIEASVRCDLSLIDDILRLCLAAVRMSWSIRLTRVDEELRQLVELVGLSDRLGI